MSDATAWLQQNADWPYVFEFFSDEAGPVGWWIVLQMVILFAGTHRGLRLAWFVGIAALSNTLLKWLWAEPRPYLITDAFEATRAATGFGMPSGHAQGATALWLGLVLALGEPSSKRGRSFWLIAVALIFVVFTDLSRVFFGVHSVSQVIVGTALGAATTVALWLLLPQIEARLRAATFSVRTVFAVFCLGAAFAVGWIVYLMRADFVAPQEWLARFEATQIRTGHTGDLGALGLVEPNSLVLIALLAGYAILALAASRTGHYVARSVRARGFCLLFAVAVNVGCIGLLRAADAGVLLAALWLMAQPVLALWLPLRMFGEPLSMSVEATN